MDYSLGSGHSPSTFTATLAMEVLAKKTSVDIVEMVSSLKSVIVLTHHSSLYETVL